MLGSAQTCNSWLDPMKDRFRGQSEELGPIQSFCLIESNLPGSLSPTDLQ